MAPPLSPARKIYTRLPGSGGASFQRTRLWLAPDHLLLVGSTLIGERYKRFYFTDIQAFVIQKTSYWWSALALLLGVLLFGGIALAFHEEPAAAASFGAVAGVFVALLIWHFVRGETCSFQIRTAVQTEKIPSLSRIRVARRVIERLRPLIEAAQSPTSPMATHPGP